ncbi:Cytochrome P450 monooxygenase 98 [Psilocybe cubensis]|uniref:Cytochrome P450 monooxygenase 98 n=1 Tax=Psilocybe cubensis TaxID=181762 RepID=A0ACB8GSS8_PSICU|nr:Cytochrome P450 monooxygenase 98 [Psilocybe cubensis]KAH9478040.1 Cytochrome P450 monooxygenase 98 [Psilocybe cubensis]
MAFETTNGILLAASLFAGIVLYLQKRKRYTLPYPPGPKKHFLLGNLLDVPTTFAWKRYAEWGKTFDSDVLHLSVAGSHFIILNSFKAANDLFEKRSSIYSSRIGWDWLMSGMVYGEPWRERRKAFQQYFHVGNAHLYEPVQMQAVRKMLPRLLKEPEDFLSITRHALGSMALTLAYGLDIQEKNDPYLRVSEAAVKSIGEVAIPGAFLVDMIPALKYVPEFFPGAGFKKKARIWRKVQENMREIPFAATLKNIASGSAKVSFTSTCLENLDESRDVDHQRTIIKDTAGNMFAAATDTTISAIHTFFVAMLCFPEVQKKAQQEIDRVLQGRLPEFSDEADLPYLSALVKETLRWEPSTPIGVPHYSSEDDVYNGYHIPKGSLVIGNAWAMLHNEEDYPEPSLFKPERFIKDGKLNPNVRDPAEMAFGFGRRLCPGNHIAISALWLTAATVLATFNITEAIDDDGRPIKPCVEYESALICHPLPFKCTIKPRSKECTMLIQAAADSY